MKPAPSKKSDEFYIETFHFCRNDGGELIKIQAGNGLLGFLVFDSKENSFQQIRLFKPEKPGELESQQQLWERVQEKGDSPLLPVIQSVGIDDEVAYYVSAFRDGMPLGRYLKQQFLPAAVACRLTVNFIRELRSLDVIPPDKFSHRYDSLWIGFQGKASLIFLGDVAPFASENAESENVKLCLELLHNLIGPGIEPAFEMFFQSIEPGKVSLKKLESWLKVYLDCNPPTPEYWTEKTIPGNYLNSLVPEVETFFEDSPPVANEPAEEALPAHPAAREKSPQTGFKFQYLVEIGAFLLAVGFLLHYMGFGSRGTEASPVTTGNTSMDHKTPEMVIPDSDQSFAANSTSRLEIPTIDDRSELRQVKSPGVLMEVELPPASVPQLLSTNLMAPEGPGDQLVSTKISSPAFLPGAEAPLAPPSASLETELEQSDLSAEDSMPPGDQPKPGLETASLDLPKKVESIPGKSLPKEPTILEKADELREIRKTGEELFALKNPTEEDRQTGFSYLMRAAKEGDAAAQFLVGECILLGKGTEKDPERAVGFLEKAVNQGDHRAMDLLGVCHHRGWGVPTDHARAVSLFQSAIDRGNTAAYYNLGARYAQGQGVKESPTTAAELFSTGAEKGDAHCMLVYARCFESGFGRKKNIATARHWYQLSARAGNHEAIQWCTRNGVSF